MVANPGCRESRWSVIRCQFKRMVIEPFKTLRRQSFIYRPAAMMTSHLKVEMWAQPKLNDKHSGKLKNKNKDKDKAPSPPRPDAPENSLPADDLLELTTPTLTAEDIPWESRLGYYPHLHRWPT